MSTSNRENVTIKEIARRADVSVSTVSRVMSGTKTAIPISEKTRQKVMLVCDEMRFLPDVNYTRLQERRSHTVALLTRRPAEGGSVFLDANLARLVDGLEPALAARGYSLVVSSVDEKYEQERRHLRILRNNSVDGLLIWDAFRDPDVVAELRRELRPAICVGHGYDAVHHHIVADDAGGMGEMTRHVLGLGHCRIGLISGELRPRLELGYREAMTQAGASPRVEIAQGQPEVAAGVEAANRLLDADPRLTAILATSDALAIGAMDAARMRGVDVPGRLSVAGFGNSEAAALVRPALTTARLPMAEIAREAVRTILAMIEELPEGPYEEVVARTLPITIVPRASTGLAPIRL